MSLKKNTYFLGLGCAGGKLHKEFISRGYKGAAVNGSEQDLKALGDVPTKFKLEGFDGFGGYRDRAMDCLAANEELMEFVAGIKEQIVFLLFGGGGSTGSGCATILAELLLEQQDKIVCPVIALPSAGESIIKHKNAYQAVAELQDLTDLGATFFLNNEISEDYGYINGTFAKMLDMFLANNSYGEVNNFDESERMEMLKDNGAAVLSMFGAGKSPEIMLEKLMKSGIFAPVEDDKVCENIGVIHSGRNNQDITAGEIVNELGKPQNVFEGYNGRATLIAASGMSFPVTHVSKIGELAQKAYEERQRNKRQVSGKKLGDLSFVETAQTKPAADPTVPKKLSKLEILKRRRFETEK